MGESYNRKNGGSKVKKYIIFAISFILLFLIFQIVFGVIITYMYTPDIQETWYTSGGLSQTNVHISSHYSFLPTFLIAFLAATIAYFIPKRMTNPNSK